MKLSEMQQLFLQYANEANMTTQRGAYFDLGPVKHFRTQTVTSLAKRGFITVGRNHYDGGNGGRTAVSDVWVTAAGREALHNSLSA